MRLFATIIDENTFEIHLFGFRLGWTWVNERNNLDYALMFHIGFLNPGMTIMLTWRR